MKPDAQTIMERNQKVVELRNLLIDQMGSTYNLIIRESSNSRRTNMKRLTGWKLVGVGGINYGGWDDAYFFITIQSKKGIKKHLITDEIIKWIKTN
ncbi:MAG: hypothetical protein J5598_00665 [Clostridia bacterium]|nr:hypothetical protein [Clostridia bacterium]